MVNDIRVKELRIPAFDVTGSVLNPVYTDSINGDVLKVTLQNISSPGSVWLAYSGTNIEIYRRNNITSGLSSFEVYPRVFPVDETNTTGSPYVIVNRVINGPIFIAASGLTSGTAKTFGPVVVSYR